MITKKLKTIFGFSILLFILHGLEEFFTHFYDVDAFDQRIFSIFSNLSIHGATFATFQIMFWLLLTISFLLILGEKWQFRVLAIAGLIYIYELHHILKAVSEWGYYPGLITALGFPFVAVLFWKEWLKVYKTFKNT
ncbi:MAG: HXXEE domain-containing protein [Patescibacteria group bacterium]